MDPAGGILEWVGVLGETWVTGMLSLLRWGGGGFHGGPGTALGGGISSIAAVGGILELIGVPQPWGDGRASLLLPIGMGFGIDISFGKCMDFRRM